MTVVLDSSALVKRYVDEPHQDLVRSIADAMVVSAIVRVEVPSALWRKHRLGELTDDEIEVLIALFEIDWSGDDANTTPALSPVAMSDDLLASAAVHVGRHGLRALDGVQLATALLVQQVEPGVVRFACFDEDLRRAARREGLTLIP
ncbi:MAG: type II toxin-antitoxin system VapC family toxin [Ilumatobacteraceae bacterium]